jgi:hypothetical protein
MHDQHFILLSKQSKSAMMAIELKIQTNLHTSPHTALSL